MAHNHYWIMNASCLFDNCATDIQGVIDVWGGKEQTILVCRRSTSRYDGKPGGRIFVSGAGIGYVEKGTELPMQAWYTQDTGGAFQGLNDMPLLIENVIDVVGGVLKPRNMVGVTERRRAWTMK